MVTDINELVFKYLQHDLSQEEQGELDAWLAASDTHRELFANWTSSKTIEQNLQLFNTIDAEKGWNILLNTRSNQSEPFAETIQKATIDPVVHRVHFLKTAWLKYVAVLILATGVGVLYYFNQPGSTINVLNNSTVSLTPGSDKATLILSNGLEVLLNDSRDSSIIDGTTNINKEKGVLTYVPGGEKANTGINTMITPRGGQYKIILPDGTKVWLNSASSLKYPVVFNGSTREVELSGEGYFEIQANKSQPFYVKTNKAAIHVLGTSFNINAYYDEPQVAATLIDGAVKVENKKKAILLKPGEQANVISAEGDFIKKNPDLDDVLAWKNGKYKFDGATLQQIMRQVARWYNVDIKYVGSAPPFEFSGSFSKTSNPDGLLDALELTGDVHFEVSDKLITVIPGSRKKNN
jgi:transmembrane sensor